MRFRLADVRVRATAAAVGIVAIAMALAGILLVQELRTTQIAAIDTALEIRANDIESLMVDGTPPEQLSVEDEQDDFVQVIDTANRQVVAASRNISGRPPIIAGSDGTTVTMRPKGLDPEDFRVHVHPTEDGSQYTIVVGTNLENVDRVVDTTRRSLLVGLPVLWHSLRRSPGRLSVAHCGRWKQSARKSPSSAAATCTNVCPSRPPATRSGALPER